MGVLCVRCGKTDVDEADVSMSSDGWMCGPCFKAWDRAEAAKTPRPWFSRQKRSLEDLPPGTIAEFNAAKRRRALRWTGGGVGLVVIGLAGSSILYGWI